MIRMPIAYAINNEYTKPLMAQLLALYQHAKPQTVYDLYIVNYRLTAGNKELISQLVAQLNKDAVVTFVDITDEQYKLVPYVGTWGKETNYRGLLPTLLPDVERILYIDADTLVLEDLSHLMTLKLDDFAYAAVKDVAGAPAHLRNMAVAEKNYACAVAISEYHYINAGVMLINLAYWRANNWQSEFLRLLHVILEHKLPSYPDQDVLNYLAIRDGVNRVYYLPSTYNDIHIHMKHHRTTDNRIQFSLPIDNPAMFDEQLTMTRVNLPWQAQKLRWQTAADTTYRYEIEKVVSDRVQIIHFGSLKPWTSYRENDSLVAIFEPYAYHPSVQLLIPKSSSDYSKKALLAAFKSFAPKNLLRKHKKIKIIMLIWSVIVFSVGYLTAYIIGRL